MIPNSIHSSLYKYLSCALFLLGVLFLPIAADFEVCNPGVSKDVFQFKVEDCPFGVLFEQPIIARCMNSTSGPESFFTDLCDEENYVFNENTKPYKIHLSFGQDNETIDPDSSCVGDAPGKCNVTSTITASNTTLTEPDLSDPCDPDLPEANLTSEGEVRHRNRKIFKQTERLFKFIVGLLPDMNADGPKFRVVKLLRQSFKILGTYCDINYVPRKFSEDILNAFLFLLRDSDLSNFKDVSLADYDIIMESLTKCERVAQEPFKLNGKKCKTCSTVHTVEKNGYSYRYAANELSFTWGHQDVPVDATWGVLSFVHGLCFGTFHINLNYHHVFQRVTELLFTEEILYRWSRPATLFYEEVWDHMFSAPVRSTMRNLDVCIHAAYHNTPFLHRLERPFQGAPAVIATNANVTDDAAGSPAAPGRKRKRRDVGTATSTMTLDSEGLTGAGWCFQSKEDLLATTAAYVDLHCPDKRKPLDELIEMFKNKTFIDLESVGGVTTETSSGGEESTSSAKGLEG